MKILALGDSHRVLPKKIKDMSYTDFIGLINQENRPPGGKFDINKILSKTFIDRKSNVLEIGCSNGFTSLEIARLVECNIWAIDINKNLIENAKKRIKKEKVKFIEASAYNIPFKKSMFDLVVCGNATSFMEDKDRAIKEYIRVVKPWRFIAMSPMYYIKNPPKKFIHKISNVLKVKIDMRSLEDWLNLIKKNNLEIYYLRNFDFQPKNNKALKEYVKQCLDKPYLKKLPKQIYMEIEKRWINISKLFNKNARYLGYSIILLRKREEREESELLHRRKLS